MKCTVVIAGREAVPIRAIPFVTGWMVSPDVVATGFAMTDQWPARLRDLRACHLAGDGHHWMLPKEWDGIEAALKILSDKLKAEEKVDNENYPVWRHESILTLPSHCFVWRDDFERAFERAYGPNGILLVDERPGDRELNFAPRIPPTLLESVFEGYPGALDGIDCVKVIADAAEAQRDFEAGFLAAAVDLPLYARASELSAEAFACVTNAVAPSKWRGERSRLDIDAKTLKAIQSTLKMAECDIDSGVLPPRNPPAVWLEWGRRRTLHRAKLNTLDGQVKLDPAWENFESEVRRFEGWKTAQEQSRLHTAQLNGDGHTQQADVEQSERVRAPNEPMMAQSNNPRARVEEWVSWCALQLKDDGDTTKTLASKILDRADRFGYKSEREPMSVSSIIRMLPPGLVGQRGRKPGDKRKK